MGHILQDALAVFLRSVLTYISGQFSYKLFNHFNLVSNYNLGKRQSFCVRIYTVKENWVSNIELYIIIMFTHHLYLYWLKGDDLSSTFGVKSRPPEHLARR